MYDMHMHSIFSDGSDDLRELINNVADSGIKYFSLTDHDTAEGIRTIFKSEDLKNLIRDKGLQFVSGMEISCKYKGTKMHILAYDFDPFAKEVYEIENEMKDLLKQRNIEKQQLMKKDGYVLSEQSLKFLESRINARTLDFANCLVNDGYFDNLSDAARYISKTLKTHVSARLNSKDVIEKMSGIGAKMVWAHSLYGVGDTPITHERVEEVVSELKDIGLSGLECYYSLYNKSEIEGLIKIAEKHDMQITCGSDYHGKNKKVNLMEFSSDGTVVDLSKLRVNKIFNKK